MSSMEQPDPLDREIDRLLKRPMPVRPGFADETLARIRAECGAAKQPERSSQVFAFPAWTAATLALAAAVALGLFVVLREQPVPFSETAPTVAARTAPAPASEPDDALLDASALALLDDAALLQADATLQELLPLLDPQFFDMLSDLSSVNAATL